MTFRTNKKANRPYWSLTAVWIVLLMIMSLSITALATADLTSTVAVSGLTVSSSGGADWTGSAGGATWSGKTASSGCPATYTPTTGTLTLTNNSGETKVLSFDYTLTLSGGTVTIDGTSATANSSFKKSLANGASITISTSSSASAANTTTVTLSNIELDVPDVTITFEPASNGSYTVDGTEITASTTKTAPATTAYNIIATPAEHYVFQGWYLDEALYYTGETLSSVAFPNGGTLTAKFTADAVYNTLTVAEGTAYTKDELITINSRYYHDPSTNLISSIHSARLKESFYTVGGYTTTEGGAYSQRVPSLGWTAGASKVTISNSVTAGGEYCTGMGNSWAYYNMESDVIQFYAKEDCIISFDYSFTITELDLSMNTEGTWSRLWMLQSTNGSLDYDTIYASATQYPASETEYEAAIGATYHVDYALPKGEYLYVFTNGYTEVKKTRFTAGYSDIDISYTANLANLTVAINEVSYTQTTQFEDNLGNPLTGGVLTINGTNYNAEADATVAGLTFLEGTTITMSVATVPNNYRFIGWSVNGSTNLVSTPTYEYVLNANTTVDPVFAPNYVTFDADAGTYQYPDINGNTVSCNGEYVARNADATAFYTTLAEAFAATDVTVLLGNVTVEGNFAIPSGETLVVPNTTNTISATLVSDQYVPSLEASGSGVYATLTVNGSVEVNGTLLVAGYQSAGSGSPTGIYAAMTVNGTVTVNSRGELYGYGLVDGSGNIYAKSGSQIHEFCEILDKRHPVTMKNLVDNSGTYRMTPFNILYINTIEAKTTYESGAELYGHFSVSWGTPTQEKIKIIDTSASVFALSSGTLTKYYDTASGQTVYRVNEGAVAETGDFEVSLEVTFSGANQSASFSSSDCVMPLSSGWQLQIAGNFTITNDYKVLPGAKVDVKSSGVLTISDTANLIFYRLNDYDYRSNPTTETTARGFCVYGYPVNMSRHAVFTRDNVGSAKLNVDGTINANGGLYVTEQLIAEYTATDSSLAYQNYSHYDNGYNYLTGSGTINMGSRSSSLTCIYENLTYDQSRDVQAVEVAVVPMKGLKADATADEAAQYESLSGTVQGSTNANGFNVWGNDPCAAGHTLDEGTAEKAATCAAEGNIAYWTCSVCEKMFSDAEGATEVAEVTIEIDPAAHTYGEPTYTWAEDDSSVTAECVCENDETHDKLTETVTPVLETTTAATCAADGAGTYTATFENEAFAAQTKDVVISATGHTYGEAVVNWAEDFATYTVTVTCSACDENTEGHTKASETQTAEVATIDGDCQTKSSVTYTASGTFEGKSYEETKTVEGDYGDHSYESTVNEPTCTTGGSTTHICSVCGDTYTDGETDAAGHKEQTVIGKAATCTESGLTDGVKCATCGEVITEQTEIPALGHKYTNYTSNNDATCTADGTKTASCDNDCGKTSTVTDTGSKLEHNYTEEQSRTAATCVATGSVVKKCANCDATTTETLPIDSSNHTGNNTITGKTDATCENAGYTGDSVCECGTTVATGEEIPAKGHSWGTVSYEWNNDYSKCTASRTCSVCTETETAEAQVGTETVDATHTVDGSTTTTATFDVSWASTQTKSESIEALGHTAGTPVKENEIAATCTTAGSYESVVSCTGCGAEISRETVTVDALGHNWATTLTEGEITHWYECTREGCSEKNGETEHSYNWTTTKEASCFADGSESGTCACGATTTEVISATGNHTYSNTYTTENEKHWRECTTEGCTAKTDEAACDGGTATCTAPAICTVCQQPYGEMDADAHSWGDWSVTTSATCTAEGVETRTCAHNSAHTETNPIAKLSHSMTHHARVDTTCVAAGNVEYWSCSACNLTYSDEPGTTKLDSIEIPIDPDAHDLMTVPAQTATCTQIGWAEYQKCQRDGCDHSTYVEIPMLAHSYTTKASERLKDAATCTTAATYYVRCDHCTAVSTDKTVTVGEAKGHTEATSYVHIENTTTHNVVVSCSVCTANISTTPQNCADEDNDFKCDKCKALLVNAYTDYVDFCPEFSGEKTVDGTAVTLKYTGEVAFAPAAGNGTWNHWFGFKVTAPTGVSVANVTILRPDGETRVMENIKDGDDFAYLYWGMTKDEDKTAAYQIDWNGDGTYDLTVTLDATAATLKECEHSYDEGEVTTAPGCETAGEKTYTCANCGDIKTEPVEATGHKNTVIQNASEATCGKDGYTGDTYCNDCQMTIETGSVISATGNHTWDNACDTDCNVCGTTRETEHQWNEGVETTAPTCTAAGVKTFTCTVDGCGATKTEAIAATGHSHSTEWSKDETHHWHECACGNKGDYDVHKWNDGVETTAPTTSAPGVMTYTCSVCGATKAEEIAQLTGTMVDIDVVTKDLTSGPQIALLSGTTAGDGWSYEGSVIAGETVDFTVTFDKACVVVVATTDADGNVTYARQTATATENENTYKFSIDTSEGMEIIVAVKGDANGDGKITNADANMTKAFVLGNATPITTMGEIICDVNNKGGITNADSNMIKAYVLGNYVPITW